MEESPNPQCADCCVKKELSDIHKLCKQKATGFDQTCDYSVLMLVKCVVQQFDDAVQTIRCRAEKDNREKNAPFATVALLRSDNASLRVRVAELEANQKAYWYNQLRVLCEKHGGVPRAEQSPEDADIALWLDAFLARAALDGEGK